MKPPRGFGRRRIVLAAIGVAAVLLATLGLRLLAPRPVAAADPLDTQASRFVTLALTLGEIEPKEVDAYWGPASLRPDDKGQKPTLDQVRAGLATLAADVAKDGATAPSPRRTRLAGRIASLIALIDTIKSPRASSFEAQAAAVYGLPPIPVDQTALAKARAELDRLVPGPGPLAMRVDAFRARYVIPEDKRQAVFERALAECRKRTRAHWPLPATERLEIEWTSSVDAAWHRYQGGYRSLLQINPQAVAFLGSAIDVACHEGYPGHHAQFVMEDRAARPGGLPIEERIVLLRSPDSIFREGAANYGVDLAFPPAERTAFERDVLFPLAGLPPGQAAKFERVRALIDRLSIATAPILRDYRDGRIGPDQAEAALQRDAIVSSPMPLLGFVDDFGAYSLGYTVARDWVRDAIGRAGGDPWAALGRAVARPGLPPASSSPSR